MEFSKTERAAYELAVPAAQSAGYSVYDVEYVKEGPHRFLRVFIDRDGGVDIDDCEAVSRLLSRLLDERDVVSENYFLEVSSPGIERSLRQDEHFQAAVGQRVRLKLFQPLDGVRELTGVLQAADAAALTIGTDAGTLSVPRKGVAKAQLAFDFDS